MLPTSDNTATKYKNLNILTIPQIYMLHLGQFFFKTFVLNNNLLLHDITDELSFHHNHDTRNCKNFKLPMISTQVNKHFFLTNGTKLWNEIPTNIKSCNSLFTFKKEFKNYLFEL